MSDDRRALRELGRLYGVQETYTNVFGKRVRAGVDSTIAVLRAMGAPVTSLDDATDALRAREEERARRLVEPVIVAWDGRLSDVEIRVPTSGTTRETRFALTPEGDEPSWWETGTPVVAGPPQAGSAPARLPVGRRLPAGRHDLWIEIAGEPIRALVLSAPRRCPQPGGRWWGVFAPLYALRAEDDWGVGSFSELAAFRGWIEALGGSVAATLPLFAQFLDEPMVEPSPYSPASRLFWNETYIDVTRAPGLDGCEEAREAMDDPSFGEHLARLRKNELTDHPAVAAAKRRVLDPLAQQAFRGTPPAGLTEFAANRRAVDYARFRAEVERRGAWWGAWPRAERDGSLPGSALDDDRARYHLFVQWVASEQLSEAAGHSHGAGGLMLDLPIGVNGAGYDVWRERDSFAPDVAAGAPPDAFWSQGQDWGAPPPHPHGAREAGYRYHDEVFRTLFRYAAIARIDHVIGLHRLYWVPRGASAKDGVYVRYRAEEWYALLSIAANETGAVIVGEDLGTVPGYVRPAMKAHGLLRTYVAQREAGNAGLPEPPAESVAALNTHDMPTWAGFWRGTDVPLREELGLIDHSQAELILEARGGRGGGAARVAAGAPRRPRRRGPSRVAGGLAGAARRQPGGDRDGLDGRPVARSRPAERAGHGTRTSELAPAVSVGPRRDRAPAGRELDAGADPSGPTGRSERRQRTAVTRATIPQDLTADDLYLFAEGTHGRLAEKLGAHVGADGTSFAVWAPNAEGVSVIGDFNAWDTESHPLEPVRSSGIWSGSVEGTHAGQTYKFHIRSRHAGYRVDKADPFAFRAETPPKTGSVVWDLTYDWDDADWVSSRAERNGLSAPMAIYEVHLGSWRRGSDGAWLGYRDVAPLLAEHALDLGFTHVELLPIMEHPFYGSWGYQTTGYFAPTGRFGTPQDLMFLIDHLHQRGLGVILDWVPSHFPADEHGLAYFDGTHLYEHADPRRGYHPDWHTLIFNYGRNEVRSFLLSSADHWLRTYHADGLRVDAVASMLYLDYSRKQGEWLPNVHGGRENLEAVSFLRRLNEDAYREHPGTQTFAEESTAWPMVSRPTDVDGLGFGFKWDMGWMHDTLQHIRREPIHRRHHYGELTFRQVYAYSENFVLPLSHDEVVHGKGSLLGKMPGDDWQRFANLRLLFGYQWSQAGKKLVFMGDELGQPGEWDHDASVEWQLRDEPLHGGILRWVRDLNGLHRAEPALHVWDADPRGFEWIDASDAEGGTLCFLRRGPTDRDVIVVALNLTPMPHERFRIGLPSSGVWREALNSDAEVYGGSGMGNLGRVKAEATPWHGRAHSARIVLPPLASVFLRPGVS